MMRRRRMRRRMNRVRRRVLRRIIGYLGWVPGYLGIGVDKMGYLGLIEIMLRMRGFRE